MTTIDKQGVTLFAFNKDGTLVNKTSIKSDPHMVAKIIGANEDVFGGIVPIRMEAFLKLTQAFGKFDDEFNPDAYDLFALAEH